MRAASAKKVVLAALVILVAGAATAHAGVNLDVNIGVPVPVAPAPPPPVYYPPQPPPPPAYYPAEPAPPPVAYYPAQAPPVAQELVIDEPPQFIFSQNLGFYVSVGTPYDMVYVNNGYYLNRGGYWYFSPSYWGPWNYVQARRLPPTLHRYRYEQIRQYRDREYRHYLRDRQHYRGTWYRPAARPGWERRERHGEERRNEHGNEHGNEHRGGWDRGR